MVSNPFSSGLSVEISAQTGDFTRGISRAEDSLSDLSSNAATTSAALQVLQGRADEATDEFRSLSRGANSAARSVGALGAASAGTAASIGSLLVPLQSLNVSFAGINATGAGAVVTLGALATAATGLLSTLFPLAAVVGTITAGVGALATAFGTVIGTGILAFGEKLAQQQRERLQNLKEERSLLQSRARGIQNNIEQAQRDLQTLQARRERLLKVRDAAGSLSEEQQKQLEKVNQQIEQRETFIQQQQEAIENNQANTKATEEQIKKTEEQTSVTGALGEQLSNLKNELVPIIADFGQRFIPLIEDALAAIPQLVQNIIDAVGGLSQFRRELRNLGNAAFRILPDVAATFMDLARRALPIFRDVLAQIGRIAPDVFRAMLRITQRLGPALAGFANQFVQAVPEITALGTAILDRAVPALTDLIGWFENLLQMGQQSDGFVDFVHSAIQKLIAWVQGPGKQLLTKAVTGILDTITALLGGGSGDNVFSALTDLLEAGLSRLSTWFNQGGQKTITNTLSSLFGAMADALTSQEQQFANEIFNPVSNIIASLFDSLTNALSSDQAGRLSKALASLSQEMMETFADSAIAYAKSDAFKEDMNQLMNAVGNTLGTIATERAKSAASGEAPFTSGGFLRQTVTDAVMESQTVQQITQETTGPSEAQKMIVDVQGDGQLAQIIRETADIQIQQQARRADRTRQRGGGT